MLKKEKAPAIGQRIKAARIEKGMSQADLATKIDSHFYNISNWERGKYAPDTGVLINLAEALGVSYEYLIGTEVKPSLETGLTSEDVTAQEFGAMLDKARGTVHPEPKKEEPRPQFSREFCNKERPIAKYDTNFMFNGWCPVASENVISLLAERREMKAVDFEEEDIINPMSVSLEDLFNIYLDKDSGYTFFVKYEEKEDRKE